MWPSPSGISASARTEAGALASAPPCVMTVSTAASPQPSTEVPPSGPDASAAVSGYRRQYGSHLLVQPLAPADSPFSWMPETSFSPPLLCRTGSFELVSHWLQKPLLQTCPPMLHLTASLPASLSGTSLPHAMTMPSCGQAQPGSSRRQVPASSPPPPPPPWLPPPTAFVEPDEQPATSAAEATTAATSTAFTRERQPELDGVSESRSTGGGMVTSEGRLIG